MKRLIKIFSLVLILFILFCNSVQAIIAHTETHIYTGIDKMKEYMKYTGIGVIILLISLISLLILNKINGKYKTVKGFFILKLILNTSMIYLATTSIIFSNNNGLEYRFTNEGLMVEAFIFAIIVIVLLIKNKEKIKFINGLTVFIALVSIIIATFTYFNTNVVYYTLEKHYYKNDLLE